MTNRLNFSEHSQWPHVEGIISRLNSKGHIAYIAGGAVRDGLLGREPKDFDIVTDASEEELSQLFPQALPVGQQFGIYILPYRGFQIEVARFRKEGGYLDGRRPTLVEAGSPKEDAQRRDFTVNALFYDPRTSEVIDYVGGISDLNAKTLRTVGDPQERFLEDHLRILRACRFHSQLGFQIDSQTLQAMATRVDKIQLVSAERVSQEWEKLLLGEFVQSALNTAWKLGICERVFPSLDWKKSDRSGGFQQKRDLNLAQAYNLFVKDDISEHITKADLSGLRTVTALVNQWFEGLKLSRALLRSIVFGLQVFLILRLPMDLRLGEKLNLLLKDSSHGEWLEFWKTSDKVCDPKIVTELQDQLSEILRTGRDKAFITGETLKSRGVKPSPQFGEILHEGYILQLENRITSNEEAQAWLKSAHGL